MASSKAGDLRKKSERNQGDTVVCLTALSALTHHPFCHVLLATQTNLMQHGGQGSNEGTHPRRQGSLGAILNTPIIGIIYI